MHYFSGKRVLVYGMGRSGQSACRLLHHNEACVSVYDEDKAYANMFCFEENPFSKNFDLIVVSPGIKAIGNEIINNTVVKNNKEIYNESFSCKRGFQLT